MEGASLTLADARHAWVSFQPAGHKRKLLTTDNRGAIYIVDENGGGIVMLGRDGSFMGRQLSMGWNEGLLYYPSQMSINEKGEVFIADRGNSRVQIFSQVK